MSVWVADRVGSGDAQDRAGALRLVLSMPLPRAESAKGFWRDWGQVHGRLYAAEITSAAGDDFELRILALYADTLTAQDALAMPGSLGAFLTSPLLIETPSHTNRYASFLNSLLLSLLGGRGFERKDAFTAIGQYAMRQEKPPWIRISGRECSFFFAEPSADELQLPALDHVGILGVAVVLCVTVEIERAVQADMTWLGWQMSENGYTRTLNSYLRKRAERVAIELPDLPVPPEFEQVLRDWAEGQVNFVEFHAGT